MPLALLLLPLRLLLMSGVDAAEGASISRGEVGSSFSAYRYAPLYVCVCVPGRVVGFLALLFYLSFCCCCCSRGGGVKRQR